MAEALNVHFTNIAKMLARDIPVGEIDAESFLSPSDNSFSLKPPSIDIVLDLLKKIDEKKATGLDKIPSKSLKMAASIFAPSLTDVFTKSILTGSAKVLEKLVYDQLYHYLNDNKLLSSCQSGFRALHSTITALLEATNSWSVNIDNGFLNGVVFIDLKKAFDTIDHEIILRKMSYFGADQETITWFQSYLSNRI